MSVFGTIGGLGLGTFLGWAMFQALAAVEEFGVLAIPSASSARRAGAGRPGRRGGGDPPGPPGRPAQRARRDLHRARRATLPRIKSPFGGTTRRPYACLAAPPAGVPLSSTRLGFVFRSKFLMLVHRGRRTDRFGGPCSR